MENELTFSLSNKIMTKIESDIIWALGIFVVSFFGMMLILGISACVIGKQENQREEIIAESLIGKTIQ